MKEGLMNLIPAGHIDKDKETTSKLLVNLNSDIAFSLLSNSLSLAEGNQDEALPFNR